NPGQSRRSAVWTAQGRGSSSSPSRGRKIHWPPPAPPAEASPIGQRCKRPQLLPLHHRHLRRAELPAPARVPAKSFRTLCKTIPAARPLCRAAGVRHPNPTDTSACCRSPQPFYPWHASPGVSPHFSCASNPSRSPGNAPALPDDQTPAINANPIHQCTPHRNQACGSCIAHAPFAPVVAAPRKQPPPGDTPTDASSAGAIHGSQRRQSVAPFSGASIEQVVASGRREITTVEQKITSCTSTHPNLECGDLSPLCPKRDLSRGA